MTKPAAEFDFAYAEWPTGLPDDFDFSEWVLDGVPMEDASIVQEGPAGAAHETDGACVSRVNFRAVCHHRNTCEQLMTFPGFGHQWLTSRASRLHLT